MIRKPSFKGTIMKRDYWAKLETYEFNMIDSMLFELTDFLHKNSSKFDFNSLSDFINGLLYCIGFTTRVDANQVKNL